MSYKGQRDFIEMNGGPVCVRDDNDNHHNMFFVPPFMYWIDIPASGGLLKTHFHKAEDKPSGTEGVDFLRQFGGGFIVDMFQCSHPDADAMIVAVDSVVGANQFTCKQLAYDSDRDWSSPKAAVTFLTGTSKNETKEVATFNTSTGELTFGSVFSGVAQGDMILIASKGWADASVTTQPAVGSIIARSRAFRTPWVYMNLADAKTVCANRGAGFHLTMNHEWWDLAVWMILQGYVPLGNNAGSNGPSTPPRSETDITKEWLIDPVSRVLNNSYNRALTGSGGPQSGHNLSLAGILDLNGNVWEWVDGLYLNAGTIMVSKKPDPTYPGDYINTGLNISNGGIVTSDQDIKSIRFDKELLGHGIPHESAASDGNYDNDHIYYNAADLRAAVRGGRWDTSSGRAGVFALNLYRVPSSRYYGLGFRASLVL
jgi:hypothetical protein